MVPVLDDAGAVTGVVTEGNMTSRLLSGRCRANDSVREAGVIYKTFHKFTMNDTLATIAQALDHDPFVLIVTEQRCFSSGPAAASTAPPPTPRAAGADDATSAAKRPRTGSDDAGSKGGAASASPAAATSARLVTRSVVSGIVSRIDLLDYISRHDEQPHPPAAAS
jgi:CBS domain-containing protein